MYDWVNDSFNTIGGECPHECSYCHPAGTKVMMGDYTQKPIEKVQIGDEIIGLQKITINGKTKGYLKFLKTKVVDLSTRYARTLKFETVDGNLICTPEHPLLGSTEKRNGTDWKAAKAFSPYEHLRYVSSSVKGVSRSPILSISAHKNEIVYNLQTESENFIANGFVVHNCYVKKFRFPALRKKYSGEPRLYENELKRNLGRNKIWFVGSCFDLFADGVEDVWIAKTLEHCRSFPDNKYLFQTKNPGGMYDWIDEFPKNSIIGTTIETNRFYADYMGKAPLPQNRAFFMKKIADAGFVTMVTIEPIIAFKLDFLVDLVRQCHPQWINIGADSQKSGLPEPTGIEVEALIAELKKFTEVKIKKNLRRLML